MTTVRLLSAYGKLRRGTEYALIARGRDYHVVRGQGQVINVPDNVIAPAHYRFEEDDREVEVEEDEEYYGY